MLVLLVTQNINNLSHVQPVEIIITSQLRKFDNEKLFHLLRYVRGVAYALRMCQILDYTSITFYFRHIVCQIYSHRVILKYIVTF